MAEMRDGLFIDGVWRSSQARFADVNPYSGETLAEVAEASQEDIGAALDAAAPPAIAPYERAQVLLGARERLKARREAAIGLVVAETGFTRRDATGEFDRCLETLALSAEEAKRLAGEVVPFAGAPGGAGRWGHTRLYPVGTVVCITPFNAPLNTVAHKIAPAFAAGNAVILKPSEKAPLSAALLVEALAEAGAPAGSLALLHGAGAAIVPPLLADPRPGFYAFTGSTEVGRIVHRSAGLRRTQMELGSVSATIALADADPAAVARAVAQSGYRKAGQVCTSVQILLVEAPLAPALTDALTAAVEALTHGDPSSDDTDLGPVISAAAGTRIREWVAAAEAAGARLLRGGGGGGAMVPPVLLDRVGPDMAVTCREIFGPVVSIIPVADLDEAVGRVNASPYGLATGIFTNDLARAEHAVDRLETGAVHVNQTSSARADLMPYGGWKDSGFGHEGPAYAIRQMSREKLVSYRTS
ncbi:MAG: aldehyde dehydrogenase family protein [Pseudomonadota bacterium]